MHHTIRTQDLELAIDDVVQSYDGPQEINNLESAALPNKRTVVEAYNHIKPVIYLGFYSMRSLRRENLRFAVSEHLYPAYESLVEQIVRANRVIADNFTQTFIDLTAGYLHRFGDGYITSRFYGGGKLVGGIALLDPKPIPNGGLVYGNFGVVAALEFATMVDHFSVGLDVGYRFILGPNVSALTIAARVQYTF